MKNRISVCNRLSILKLKWDKKLERFPETSVGKMLRFVLSCCLKAEWIEVIQNLL